MNWRALLPLLMAPICIACLDDKDDDDDDGDDTADRDTTWGTTGTGGGTTGTTTGTPSLTASVTWGANSIDIALSGGPGAYWFGMAETVGCDDCWTAEDCVFGYDAGGTTLAYCHDVGDTGMSLSYGGDPSHLMYGTTVFPSAAFDGYVTYYLLSDHSNGGDDSCYVWGADASYYDGLGCTVL